MGLGGKVMGGLATGLAVGAGVMAAQAIGKSLMGNDELEEAGRILGVAGSGLWEGNLSEMRRDASAGAKRPVRGEKGGRRVSR